MAEAVPQTFSGKGDSSTRSLTPACTWRVKLDLTVPGVVGQAAPSPQTCGSRRTKATSLRRASCGRAVCPRRTQAGAAASAMDAVGGPRGRGTRWIWGLFSDPLYRSCCSRWSWPSPWRSRRRPAYPPVSSSSGWITAGRTAACSSGRARSHKVTEKLSADLVGLSGFDYSEPVPCGTVRFLDTVESMSKSFI